MFEELRKKISGAIKGIIKKEEAEQARESVRKEEPIALSPNQKAAEAEEETKNEKVSKQKEKKEASPIQSVPAAEKSIEIKKEPGQEVQNVGTREKFKSHEESGKISGEAIEGAGSVEDKTDKIPKREEKLLKVSFASKIKGVFAGSITLSDNEISEFVDKVKISFLEADVSYGVAEELSESIRESLKGMKVSPSKADSEFIDKVRESMISLLSSEKEGVDLLEFVKARARQNLLPVKILFLGPNGTGKTTTIAKIAYMLKQNGISALISASDTFRAAAIEQTEYHANRVGVPVVKSKYGADPSSVAFDAIAHAKAQSIEVVLIDSAGRQETNKNLISEIQKLVRVTKPDLTIFVAESTAGSALAGQIKEFNNVAKIDGIILTKLDCDAKGGNALSIAKETGIPILYLGTGESYGAIVKFKPLFIVDNILPKAS
ncbi:MAG: signal recognition particle-docking protein FtsY [Candidatus Micrarchaeia archaeon]